MQSYNFYNDNGIIYMMIPDTIRCKRYVEMESLNLIVFNLS